MDAPGGHSVLGACARFLSSPYLVLLLITTPLALITSAWAYFRLTGVTLFEQGLSVLNDQNVFVLVGLLVLGLWLPLHSHRQGHAQLQFASVQLPRLHHLKANIFGVCGRSAVNSAKFCLGWYSVHWLCSDWLGEATEDVLGPMLLSPSAREQYQDAVAFASCFVEAQIDNLPVPWLCVPRHTVLHFFMLVSCLWLCWLWAGLLLQLFATEIWSFDYWLLEGLWTPCERDSYTKYAAFQSLAHNAAFSPAFRSAVFNSPIPNQTFQGQGPTSIGTKPLASPRTVQDNKLSGAAGRTRVAASRTSLELILPRLASPKPSRHGPIANHNNSVLMLPEQPWKSIVLSCMDVLDNFSRDIYNHLFPSTVIRRNTIWPGVFSLNNAQRTKRLFRHRQLVIWAAQALSLLGSASSTDDYQGVVQASLEGVLSSLLAVLIALERFVEETTKLKGGIHFVRTDTSQLVFHIDNAIQRLVLTFYDKLSTCRFANKYAARLQKYCQGREIW